MIVLDAKETVLVEEKFLPRQILVALRTAEVVSVPLQPSPRVKVGPKYFLAAANADVRAPGTFGEGVKIAKKVINGIRIALFLSHRRQRHGPHVC